MNKFKSMLFLMVATASMMHGSETTNENHSIKYYLYLPIDEYFNVACRAVISAYKKEEEPSKLYLIEPKEFAEYMGGRDSHYIFNDPKYAKYVELPLESGPARKLNKVEYLLKLRELYPNDSAINKELQNMPNKIVEILGDS